MTLDKLNRRILEIYTFKHSVDKHKRLRHLFVGRDELKVLRDARVLKKPREGWYGVYAEYQDMEVCRIDADSYLEVF